ncbi:MAG: (d)CMP kinase [Bacteroidales bacterium]|nr:(d)CMP kinase [Candidatus Liminaster caballi]
MKKITIAIDGHSSCGKSTMAKRLAEELCYVYVDTGAMYRAVTLYALQNGLMDADTKEINEDALHDVIDQISIRQEKGEDGKVRTYLNGQCVEEEIRQMRVSSCVSPIAALGFVRSHLVACQQQMGAEGGIVMDGRDIGTVVFPNAELKIFVTASAEVRAQRRLAELQSKGDTSLTLAEVLENVVQRDYIDSHREVSPLVQAEDALLLDNSNLTIPQQNEIVLAWAKEKIGC